MKKNSVVQKTLQKYYKLFNYRWKNSSKEGKNEKMTKYLRI